MAAYFYVASDEARNIVTGVTSNLAGAMRIHKSGEDEQTRATRLVFARAADSLQDALEYERFFLRLTPTKRERLIDAVNPGWADWSDDIYPALAGKAFAEAATEVLDLWLSEDEGAMTAGEARPFLDPPVEEPVGTWTVS